MRSSVFFHDENTMLIGEFGLIVSLELGISELEDDSL